MRCQAQSISPAHIYCRKARRLRARFWRHPTIMHQALVDLAHNPAHRTRVPLPLIDKDLASDDTTSAIERAFAAHVADQLDGNILRYSQRLSLLKAAERLRINRFRANLIIAMVQHEAQPAVFADAMDEKPRPRKWTVGSIVAVVLFGEAMLVVMAGFTWGRF